MINISENSLSNLGIESSINNNKLLELFLQSEQDNIATDRYHQMSHEDLRDGHYFAKQTLYKYLAVKNEKPLTAEAYYTISKKIKYDHDNVHHLFGHLKNSLSEYIE